MPSYEELVQRLADPPGYSFLRQDALAQLRLLGDARAVPHVLNALSDSDAYVRAEAARCLGSLRDPSAVAPLGTLVTSDSDENVRRNAAEALGSLGDPAGRAALEAAQRDPAIGVRWAAESALKRSDAGAAAPGALTIDPASTLAVVPVPSTPPAPDPPSTLVPGAPPPKPLTELLPTAPPPAPKPKGPAPRETLPATVGRPWTPPERPGPRSDPRRARASAWGFAWLLIVLALIRLSHTSYRSQPTVSTHYPGSSFRFPSSAPPPRPRLAAYLTPPGGEAALPGRTVLSRLHGIPVRVSNLQPEAVRQSVGHAALRAGRGRRARGPENGERPEVYPATHGRGCRRTDPAVRL